MKNRYKFLIILLLSIFPVIMIAQSKEIAAYYTEFRSDQKEFYLKDIDKNGSASKITTINYAFIIPSPDSTGRIKPQFMNANSAYQNIYTADLSVDGTADDSSDILKGEFNQLKKLKKKYPHLKILIAIGGWEGSKYFSDMVRTNESREHFINECIDMFIYGNLPAENNSGGTGSAKGIFDGFDIDWEFPAGNGLDSNNTDKNDIKNFSAFLKLFREKLDEINTGFLLTAALPAGVSLLKKYNLKEDQNYVDWFNVMTYDFHGSWGKRTGHHTNILSSPDDPDTDKKSLDKTIKFLIDSLKINRDKIIPGAAFFNKGWRNVSPFNNGLYQEGISDSLVKKLRIKNYNYNNNFLENNYRVFWDDNSLAAWIYNSNHSTFYTFDDVRSAALKSRYADAYNLRGIMFWEISGDDSSGTLVNTIYNKNMPDISDNIIETENVVQPAEIISPENNEYFSKGSDIIIKTDADKKLIKRVEFFIDDKSIGFNTHPPFNWAWFNASPGKHKITIEAVDINGRKIISKNVIIFIGED